MIRQLKTSEVAGVLAKLVSRQDRKCAICGLPFTARDGAVLDHDHETGFIRDAIHRSCNGAEGKVKVKARLGHKGVSAHAYLIGLGNYLTRHSTPRYNYIHPTHMTPEMIREERNKKAREARARRPKQTGE